MQKRCNSIANALELRLSCINPSMCPPFSDELKELLKIAEIPAIVKKLQKHKDSRVQKQAKEVSSILGKGWVGIGA